LTSTNPAHAGQSQGTGLNSSKGFRQGHLTFAAKILWVPSKIRLIQAWNDLTFGFAMTDG